MSSNWAVHSRKYSTKTPATWNKNKFRRIFIPYCYTFDLLKMRLDEWKFGDSFDFLWLWANTIFQVSVLSFLSLSLKQYYLAAIGSSRFLSKLSLMQKLWFTYPLHSYILHKVHEIYISGEEEKLILFQKVHLKNLDTYLGKYYLIFMWSHLCQIDIKIYQTYLFIYHLSLNFQNWNHQSWIYMVRFTSYITELNSCIWKILFRKKEIRKVQIPRIV